MKTYKFNVIFSPSPLCSVLESQSVIVYASSWREVVEKAIEYEKVFEGLFLDCILSLGEV